MNKMFVGVDIGGTNTIIGIFDEYFQLKIKHSFLTNSYFPDWTDNPVRYLDTLAAEIKAAANEIGVLNQLTAVGIGVPGQVDGLRGIVYDATNLGWDKVYLAKELQWRLGLPVAIEHDVRTMALGESLAGAGQGCKDVVCVALGTGIAAGVMIGGELLRGSNFSAGEIGHDIVDGLEYLCNCGKIGCLETISSAPGIARLANDAIRQGKKTILSNIESDISSLDVFEACEQGDEVAERIFTFVAEKLGEKLCTIIKLLDPERVIITGGVSKAGSYLMQPLRHYILSHLPERKENLQIVPGKLGGNGGLVGAAHHAAHALKFAIHSN